MRIQRGSLFGSETMLTTVNTPILCFGSKRQHDNIKMTLYLSLRLKRFLSPDSDRFLLHVRIASTRTYPDLSDSIMATSMTLWPGLDCEMVGVGPGQNRENLGRVR